MASYIKALHHLHKGRVLFREQFSLSLSLINFLSEGVEKAHRLFPDVPLGCIRLCCLGDFLQEERQ